MLNAIEKNALQYIRNAGAGATVSNFVEDHDPIGKQVLDSLLKKRLVSIRNGQITLMEKDPGVGA